MKVRLGAILLAAGCVIAWSAAWADVESGPKEKTGGPFDVKAITGENKGKTLCYV
jgi:hypothetical protein